MKMSSEGDAGHVYVLFEPRKISQKSFKTFFAN